VRTGKLTVKGIESILSGKASGRYHGDGGGLWLVVTKRDDKGRAVAGSYVYRYSHLGKPRELGLGSAWDIELKDAREKARQYRVEVRTNGTDVVAAHGHRAKVRQRREADIAKKAEAAKRKTFREVAEDHIDANESGWRNDKHRYQWRQSLNSYAYPYFGDLPVGAVETVHVVDALKAIWLTKTETASRLRGRIEKILDRAKVEGLREGENPARWAGHLEHLLPRKTKIAPVEHHAALPYRDLGQFVAELRAQDGTAAKALELAILCTSRTGEVIGMQWGELELGEKIWIVPPERMKAGREHRVALSGPAIEILDEMAKIRDLRPSPYVFQGAKDGAPLSNMSMLMLLRRMGHPGLTVHGFRSTFADWCGDQTNFPRDLRELQLAHAVSDETEAAYRRSDGLQKRFRLVEAWARYCDKPAARNGSGNVVSFQAAS
jgi:integrase